MLCSPRCESCTRTTPVSLSVKLPNLFPTTRFKLGRSAPSPQAHNLIITWARTRHVDISSSTVMSQPKQVTLETSMVRTNVHMHLSTSVLVKYASAYAVCRVILPWNSTGSMLLKPAGTLQSWYILWHCLQCIYIALTSAIHSCSPICRLGVDTTTAANFTAS